MDENRSTTPPLPPPESPETLLQQPRASSHHRPASAQPEREDQEGLTESMEVGTQESKMEPDRQSRLPRPLHGRVSEPLRGLLTGHQADGRSHAANIAHAPYIAAERPSTPGTPANLTPFDWADLEARFEKALADANTHEDGLVAEFEALVKYFNIWASTASAHDNERAVKRLQTRSHFVKLKETDLGSKRQNYEQVVQAFQSAMLLLNQAQT